jgi:hypothetical protein
MPATDSSKNFRLEEVLFYLLHFKSTPMNLQIFRYLTGALTMNYEGIQSAYPGASRSVYELLCEHVYAQHPEFRALDISSPTSIISWLVDTEEGRKLGSPDDIIALARLSQEQIREHLIAVAVDDASRTIKAWRVGSEDPDGHRIDAWCATRSIACLYYLDARSFRLKNGAFALAVKPTGSIHHFGRENRHPFPRTKPQITLAMLNS